MNKNKKYAILLAIFLIIFQTNIFAATKINILIDGKPLNTETGAIIKNNRTMLPFRDVFENLGADSIMWDQQTKTVTGIKGETAITLSIANDVAFVNGEPELIETPPVIINNYTFIPLSFISQKLGYNVIWENNTKTVKIMSPEYYDAVKNDLPKDTPEKPDTAPVTVPEKPEKDSKATPKGNVNAQTISGTFAMQNLNRNKYVMQFRKNGKFDIASVNDKKVVQGTFTVKDDTINFTSDALSGKYTVNMIKGEQTYYVFRSINGNGAFAITNITNETYMDALKTK